jgi:ADP-ribose pyrophosphatase YjhB (NUDIX family)
MSEIAARHARFNYRVAAVFIHDGHALLHRGVIENFWILPGGRPEIHEASHEAIVREMHEEMGLWAEIERLLWVVENFFVYEGERAHELTFYYLMKLPAQSGYEDVHREFSGFEGDLPIIFRWFPVDQLSDVPIYPTFLRTSLIDLPASPVHLIHTDA